MSAVSAAPCGPSPAPCREVSFSSAEPTSACCERCGALTKPGTSYMLSCSARPKNHAPNAWRPHLAAACTYSSTCPGRPPVGLCTPAPVCRRSVVLAWLQLPDIGKTCSCSRPLCFEAALTSCVDCFCSSDVCILCCCWVAWYLMVLPVTTAMHRSFLQLCTAHNSRVLTTDSEKPRGAAAMPGGCSLALALAPPASQQRTRTQPSTAQRDCSSNGRREKPSAWPRLRRRACCGQGSGAC